VLLRQNPWLDNVLLAYEYADAGSISAGAVTGTHNCFLLYNFNFILLPALIMTSFYDYKTEIRL
jgi:hypothetical protein